MKRNNKDNGGYRFLCGMRDVGKNTKISVVMLYPGCNVLLDYNADPETIARRLKNTNLEIWDPAGKTIKKYRLYEVKKRDRKVKKN